MDTRDNICQRPETVNDTMRSEVRGVILAEMMKASLI
jgi:hypothetical protein